MATRRNGAPEEDSGGKHAAVPACEVELASSALAAPPGEEEPFAWGGPTTIRLARTPHGFGFTLRHFIVYPPESAVNSSLKDEDCVRRGRPRNRLEPMDTIFVKQVRTGGPAHEAGLCTGDRIVKVNGESIIGKTYSQVIGLIQKSDPFLELCVMPKDEDILQLAYSQDAYLKGSDAYSGHAHQIPDPPLACYPRIDTRVPAMAQAPDANVSQGVPLGTSTDAQLDLGYRREVTVPPPTLQSTNADLSSYGSRISHLGPSHRTDFCLPGLDPAPNNPRHLTMSSPASQFTPCRRTDLPAGGLASYPGRPDGRTDPFSPHLNAYAPQARSSTSSASHQNIDWRTYKTYKEYIDHKQLHAYGSRTIQERLDCLRAASRGPGERPQPAPCGQGFRRRSTSHDRAYPGPPGVHPPRSVSHDRLGTAELAARTGNWPRSASQDGFLSSQQGEPKARTRSFDYLEPVERRGYGRVITEEMKVQHPEGGRAGRSSLSMRVPVHRSVTAYSGSSFRQVPMAQHFPKGPEPLLSNVVGRTPWLAERGSAVQRAVAAGVLSHPGQQRSRTESLRVPGRESELVSRTASCSVSSKSPALRQPSGHAPSSNGAAHFGPSGPPDMVKPPQTLGVEGALDPVVLREKPALGRPGVQPLRHHSYLLAVNELDGDAAAGVTCWLPNDARREVQLKRLDEQQQSSSSSLEKSLDAIPFIDEPSSPTADHGAAHIPASAVICVSAPPPSTSPSPATPSPLMRRQLSHDQDSLRNIQEQSGNKTERSKSFDEGLDNYREEGRPRSSSKHIPAFRGLKKTKALDGYKSSEDSGSRRDSSSDIFSDSSKEGWLHFRQLTMDKSKRVGGGIRTWKQMYAVLRGHSLYLYKDRKEGLAQASSASDSDLQSISVKACLIDISYCDTKRKNVLRLTTSDCEYLFQAEDREDMLSWIRVIQENQSLDEESAGVTSRDLISKKIKEYNMMSCPSGKTEPSPKASRQSLSIRQTLLGGKGDSKATSMLSPKQDSERKTPHKDDASPPKDRSAWRKGIPSLMKKPFEKKPTAGVTFGVRLDDCPPAQSNPFVPLIVEVCCNLVEERGLEYTGIYRVPGNNAAISSMQEELNNKGLDDIDIQDDKWKDLNVISSLLKSFFRKLPEPLFTNEKYAHFIDANRTENAVERLKVLKRLLQQLPDHHYETLKFLSAHLKTVAENCEKNKMEPRNLAIVFGPTLVRTSEDNMTHMVTHMPDQYKIVETLIQQYDWFFTEEGDEEPTSVIQREGAVESQPLPNIDHLLPNIKRTAGSPGEVSGNLPAPDNLRDSATSDSAKSKGSWGPGKEQYSKDLLRTSIFAAASRKRKKVKEKPALSSSDDDLDRAVLKKEAPGQSRSVAKTGGKITATAAHDVDMKGTCGKDAGKVTELPAKGPKEQEKVVSQKEPDQTGPPAPPPCPKLASSPSLGYRLQPESSLSDPPSHCDDATSDLGTLNSTSSQMSTQRSRHGKRAPLEVCGPAADVCSITSDYSTTSSMTFLTGHETGLLSPEVQSVAESRGDEADDERSELVSEGRPADTDSESDFPIFASHEGSQERITPSTSTPAGSLNTGPGLPAPNLCRPAPKPSFEGGLDSKELGYLSKGRPLSRSESEKQELAWRLRMTERLKCRLRNSADDMFGVGAQNSGSPEARKRKGIRRRHTMGGQSDFAELGVAHIWRGRSQESELSAMDRLKPKCSSQDFSIRDWIARERSRSSSLAPAGEAGGFQGAAAEQLNGDYPERRVPPVDTHKPSGSQVVRSRFYQYL
ncbi:rho GTPase-activating protein 21-like isoform X2 [Brienomyrus brachyistius]|uniref:rho GTPase-activating protein 21-like isoform X2 n=1 Tax=Brienomyrus brachyistius TaxID=42636 RepID=UPI0020B3B323|nr:rho GTPase-activating protein 21-like isoform X2 [Brienomyrus brachyistius]